MLRVARIVSYDTFTRRSRTYGHCYAPDDARILAREPSFVEETANGIAINGVVA